MQAASRRAGASGNRYTVTGVENGVGGVVGCDGESDEESDGESDEDAIGTEVEAGGEHQHEQQHIASTTGRIRHSSNSYWRVGGRRTDGAVPSRGNGPRF